MIARETSQARQAFQDIQNAGENGFAKDDADLAKFFSDTTKTLLGPGTIPARPLDVNGPSYQAFAALLFGLRDVELADATNAVAWLEQTARAQPGVRFAWIGDFKPIAQKYLDDCKLYLDWKKEADEAKDPAAVAHHLENTRGIVENKKFKARTPLSDQVFAEEKNLSRQIADQQKAESARREQQRKKQAEQAAQEVARKRPQWLADWRSKLIDDLNRTHFTGEITDLVGAKYSGIDGATEQTLTMKIGPYGSAQVPWGKFSPQTLLALSTTFIKPGTSDAADREWRCAIFASETGQKEEARKLAEAAAAKKPEYRDQLSLLK